MGHGRAMCSHRALRRLRLAQQAGQVSALRISLLARELQQGPDRIHLAPPAAKVPLAGHVQTI
jgi:hypothetical protein